MNDEKTYSKLHLKGRITEKPHFAFFNAFGIKVYSTTLEVKRLSGASDMLPIYLPENLILPIEENIFVEINGEIRSKNLGTKLSVYVWAKEIIRLESEEYENTVKIQGYICKISQIRMTPLSCKTLLDFFVAVNTTGKSFYVPAIAWMKTAESISLLDKGTIITITGRFQSRTYQKALGDGTEETKIAYEVSTNSFCTE